jgi:hypothetical protein
MSLINQIIPQQGFEVVRDVIGAILKIELEKQKELQLLNDDINVFIGRNTPFQQSEKLMFNVLLDSADYTGSNQKSVSEKTVFFVDIYTSAKETESNDGGYLSSSKRDKYLGMIRYILQDHHYQTLGLPPGSIMGTQVDGFENFESSNNQDAAFVKMSRLTFSVRIVEDQSLWEGIEINSIFTDVKLDLTELGYQYEFIN